MQTVLSKKQIAVSRIIMGVGLLVLAALLITLNYILDLGFLPILLFASLMIFGAVLIALCFVQQNSLSLWVGALVLCCGFVSLAANYLGYAKIYPFYFLSLAAASLATACYSRAFAQHFKIIVLFVLVFALLALNSVFGVSWTIVVPAAGGLCGIFVLLSVFLSKNKAD